MLLPIEAWIVWPIALTSSSWVSPMILVQAIRADLLKHAAPESSFPQEREQETHLCSVDPYVTWSGRYQLCIFLIRTGDAPLIKHHHVINN